MKKSKLVLRYLTIFSACFLVTLFSCKKEFPVFVNANVDLRQLIEEREIEHEALEVYIDKSAYTLTVIFQKDTLKQYPVVFGGDPIRDKLMEGDKRTPEGNFGIRDKYPHAKWSKFIWIDYPNETSWKKHKRAKRDGSIPKAAAIGGEVGIHGVPSGMDWLIENKRNWTLGCISMKRADVDELYSVIHSQCRIAIIK